MKDIVILVALEEELPKDSLKEFHVEYTGVGKINACFKAIEVINAYSPKLIINYGTAGSLKNNLTGLHEVSKFFQRDMDASELGFKIGETPFDNISNISFSIEIEAPKIVKGIDPTRYGVSNLRLRLPDLI